MTSTSRAQTRGAGSYGLQQLFAFSSTSVFVLTGLVLFPLIIVGLLIDNAGLTYCGLSFLGFLIPLYVGVKRANKFDLFEPINLVAFAILFGSSLRAVWLLLSQSSRVDFIMMRTTFDDVLSNMPLILLSVLALTVGYALFPTRLKIEKLVFFRDYALGRERFWLAVGLAAGISLIGIPWMIAELGISFENGLFSESRKHTIGYISDSGEVIYGSGFQRFLAFGAVHGVNLLVAAILARYVGLSPGVIAIVLAVGAMAIITPVITSSRSSIVLMMLHMCIFAYYYKRLSLKAFIIVFAVSTITVASLGAVRQMNQTGVIREGESSVDGLLGAGNSVDFVRTSAIMDRVPSVTPHLYGESYLAVFSSVVPRAAWPEKPQVGLGGYVKGTIFGENVRLHGWPSGMIAEGWINFGIIGLFLPLFLFGLFLRIFYETVRPYLGVSFPITLLYAVSIWRLGFGTVGMNFAHGIAQTLTYALPTMVLLILVRAPTAKRTTRSARTLARA